MNSKLLTSSSVLLGTIFIVIAFVYWFVPAGSLPHYMPGFLEGSSKIHLKHGIGSLFLGLALFAFAWFESGKKNV